MDILPKPKERKQEKRIVKRKRNRTMSKAEERALERFPVHEGASKEWTELHLKNICADYIEGYHQAEKDLELTVEDIIIILDAENNILHECNDNSQVVIEAYPKGENYYGEILKRFKERKETKD